MKCRIAGQVLLWAVSFAWMVSTAAAQVTTGTCLGTVTDQAGALVAGASIELTDTGTGFQRSVLSGEDGGYVIENLKPGKYHIAASKPGFKKQTIEGVVIQVAQRARVNIAMQVGSVTELVTVQGQAPIIQTEHASVGTVVDRTQVLELPLNGRQFIQLATLTPGVFSSGGSPAGGNVSANAMSNQSNNIMLDGILNWQFGSGDQNFSPSIDMIEEFKILTNSYDAEYGLSGGAQVSLITKRGANTYHGSAYYFGRRDAFDARPFFQPGALPPFSRNSFGGSIGGAIPRSKKDFFFFNYEGLREDVGLTLVRSFPTPALKSGDFSGVSTIIFDPATLDPATGLRQPFPGNIIPANRISPVTKFFMDRYWPDPTESGIANNWVGNPDQTTRNNQYSIRYDRDFSEKDSVTFRYTYNLIHKNLPVGLIGVASGVPGTGEEGDFNGTNVKIASTHIFSPTSVNTLNLGFSRYMQLRVRDDQDQGLIAQSGMQGVNQAEDGIPSLNVSGWTNISGSWISPGHNSFNNYVVDDIFSKIAGKHSLKFGGGLTYIRFPQNQSILTTPTLNFGPRYTTAGTSQPGDQFNALADFLLGTANSASIWNNPVVLDARGKWIYAFVQDNWTASKSLTLTFGVRYEIYSAPYDKGDRMTAIDLDTGLRVFAGSVPNLPGTPPNSVTAESLGFPRNLEFPTKYNRFYPRAGFAWRMFGSDKTVLRGGFGIYGNWNTIDAQINMAIGAPFVPQVSIACNPDIPCIDAANPTVSTVILPTTGGAAASKTNTTPYTMVNSLGISHQLSGTLGFEIGYVANMGRHDVFRPNLNQPVPGPGPVAPRRPYPQFSAINSPVTWGTNRYDSLQASVRKNHDATGLTLIGSYAWSHAIGNACSGPQQAECFNIRDIRNFKADTGSTPYDRRHVLSLSWVYELPWGKGKPLLHDTRGALNQLIGGWKFGGIASFNTGTPLTPSDIVDVSNAGNSRPDLIGDPNNGPRTIQQWFNTSAFQRAPQFTFGTSGVGIIKGPGYQNFDLALYKDVVIGESKRVEFRAEFFNAFNHTNFGNPSTAFGSAGFGTISSSGPARQIQFGARFDF